MPFPWAVPGTRRLRALCGPQGTVEGGTPEAERPQTASGVLVSHGLDPQYNRRSGA